MSNDNEDYSCVMLSLEVFWLCCRSGPGAVGISSTRGTSTTSALRMSYRPPAECVRHASSRLRGSSRTRCRTGHFQLSRHFASCPCSAASETSRHSSSHSAAMTMNQRAAVLMDREHGLGYAFLSRCMECRRGLAMKILSVCPSVCPSACLSNAWFVTKCKKDLSRFCLPVPNSIFVQNWCTLR